MLYPNPSEFWADFSDVYEKRVAPVREAAEKKKYLKYIEQTRKPRGKGYSEN
jgi:hypothetical protein